MGLKSLIVLLCVILVVAGCGKTDGIVDYSDDDEPDQPEIPDVPEIPDDDDGEPPMPPRLGDPSGEIIEVEWVENVITQPLHPQASSTRLQLPAPLEDLMPDNVPIVGFGVHQGQHIEGLDHPWISVRKGVTPGAMGDGTVISIDMIQPQGEPEYMISIDYGDGLYCVHGEMNEIFVEVGDTVKHLDPLGKANSLWGLDNVDEIEIYCEDENINGGLVSSNGHGFTAVSPFDYLESDVKAAFEQAYTEKVLEPYAATGVVPEGLWTPLEPFLTNKMMIHEPNSIMGEWFLVEQDWDGSELTLMTFIEADNAYYTGNIYRLRSEGGGMGNPMVYLDGTYEVIYTATGKGTLDFTEVRHGLKSYALFEITEDAGVDSTGAKQARMKFEYSETPMAEFSEKALTYQARGVWNPRYDAWKLGGWLNYYG